MPTATPVSMFKTPESQARYFEAYEATLARWAVPLETLDIPTRFGPTHVNACGPAEAPPLVLLHGAAVSSTMWYPNAPELSRTYRIYAPDVIGELGKSVRTRPMAKPADFVDWLRDLFAGLQLARAHVAGLSFGGFLALKLAQDAPELVARLVLLAPTSLLPIRLQFYFRIAAAVLVPFISLETRQQLVLGAASPTAAAAVRQAMASTGFRYKMTLPPGFTDEELRQVQAPTLLLFGENEVIYNPEAAVRRAARLIPRLEAGILPGAGHGLTFDQPETVNRRILAFLEKEADE